MALSDVCSDRLTDLTDSFFEYFGRYEPDEIFLYIEGMIAICAFQVIQDTHPNARGSARDAQSLAAMVTISSILDKCLPDDVDEVADYLAECAKSSPIMKQGLDQILEDITSKRNTFKVVDDPAPKQRAQRMMLSQIVNLMF